MLRCATLTVVKQPLSYATITSECFAAPASKVEPLDSFAAVAKHKDLLAALQVLDYQLR